MWVVKDKTNYEHAVVRLFVKYKPVRHVYYDFWTKPGYYENNMGAVPKEDYIELDETLFPAITWEDEPLEVKLTPINNPKTPYEIGLEQGFKKGWNALLDAIKNIKCK